MFNLKEAKSKKERQSLDKHIEKMLEEYADKYSHVLKDVKTEEGLLEDLRGKALSETTTEDQLKDRRRNSDHMLTEKLLDTKKSLYNKHRVEEANSEIPKLEEKRLSTKPVMEDEEYNSAVTEK